MISWCIPIPESNMRSISTRFWEFLGENGFMPSSRSASFGCERFSSLDISLTRKGFWSIQPRLRRLCNGRSLNLPRISGFFWDWQGTTKYSFKISPRLQYPSPVCRGRGYISGGALSNRHHLRPSNNDLERLQSCLSQRKMRISWRFVMHLSPDWEQSSCREDG